MPVKIPVPPHTAVRLSGFTNSGSWGQQIRILLPGGEPVVWESAGPQDNHLVGQYTMAPYAAESENAIEHLEIDMAYDDGSGWKPSEMQAFSYGMKGLQGMVVGGQDAGGRPSGPAYHNTIVFLYFAPKY